MFLTVDYTSTVILTPQKLLPLTTKTTNKLFVPLIERAEVQISESEAHEAIGGDLQFSNISCGDLRLQIKLWSLSITTKV